MQGLSKEFVIGLGVFTALVLVSMLIRPKQKPIAVVIHNPDGTAVQFGKEPLIQTEN